MYVGLNIWSDTEGVCRRKHNKEDRDPSEELDIVGVIRGSRFRWAEHILRKTEEKHQNNERLIKKE